MKNSFRSQDDMFKVFLADENLCNLLGIDDPSDIERVDGKIRRVAFDSTVLDPQNDSVFPFFDFTFLPMYGATNNYLTYKSTIEFNIYTSNLMEARDIFEAVKKVLDTHYNDSQIIYQGQGSSGVDGIYKYIFRIYLLIRS